MILTPKRTHQLTRTLHILISLMQNAAIIITQLASIFTCSFIIHIVITPPEQLNTLSIAQLHTTITESWHSSIDITVFALLIYAAVKAAHLSLEERVGSQALKMRGTRNQLAASSKQDNDR
ncbi:hypothetical protein [Vibrio harveyi]|uniref:hypothetical protein n=1 Tax=Vibrio harveyi TaxID=669 RepID=UPI0009388214|nr:hypothetical protein [Vibrio harveyi]APP09189.1 hypothetical protein BG259_28330 [Vibrio harveyi]